MLIYLLAALLPLLVGAVWYGPLFGKRWMSVNGFTPESLQGGNMAIIFGLTYVLGLFLTYVLSQLTIHQLGLFGVLGADPQFAVEGSEVQQYFNNFLSTYGDRHRSFGHGALHGAFVAGIGFALPIVAINALFERRGWSYILLHAGYWIVTLGLMGGVVCQFVEL